MNGPVHGRCRRLFVLMMPLAFAAAAVPAARAGAAEAELSPAEVAERLSTIEVIAGDVAAAGDHKKKATLIAEGIAPVWHRVEDTVKANDRASYEALEAAIESLEAAAKAGSATRAGGAAGALTSAVNAYVAKFPAGGSAGRSAASADSETTAAAERRAAAESTAPAAAEAGDATLARTGPTAAPLAALGGAALVLGGFGVMAGAGRRTARIA